MNAKGAKDKLLCAKPILLIEGPEAASPTVKEAMDELGMARQVVHVPDVEQALERLTAQQALEPAVISLNSLTGERDSLESLRLLKSDPNTKTIPVIVLAPSGDAQIVNESFALGVAGYVITSASRDQVVQAVRAIGEYWTLSEVPLGA